MERSSQQSSLAPLPSILWTGLSLEIFLVFLFSFWKPDAIPTLLLLGLGAVILVFTLGRFTGNMNRAKSVLERVSCVMIGIALALMSYSWFMINRAADLAALQEPARVYRFMLEEDAKTSAFGLQARAKTLDEPRPLHVMLSFSPESGDLLFGTIIETRASIKAIPEAQRTAQADLVGRVFVKSFSSELPQGLFGYLVELRNTAITRLNDSSIPVSMLIAALSTGYRRELHDSELYSRFQRVGLAHLVAVSGAHLSLVVLLVSNVLRAFKLPRKLIAALSLVMILVFIIFSAVPVSAVRAGFMCASGLAAFFFHRRAASLQALGLCLLVFLMLSPNLCASPSFVLSVGSTLGILLFTQPLIKLCAPSSRIFQTAVASPVALTFASQVVTLPYSVYLFGLLPLLSPVANLVAAPLFVLACVSSVISVFLAMLIPGFQDAILGFGALCCTPLVWSVNTLATLPISCQATYFPLSLVVPLTLGFMFIARQALTKLNRLQCITSLLVILVSFTLVPSFMSLRAGDELVMLDVGQGDAFVLRSQGKTVLIDTGAHDVLLRKALGRHFITRLDAVLISHGDEDHCGALDALKGLCPVDYVGFAKETFDCSCDSCDRLLAESVSLVGSSGVTGLQVGDELRCGAFTLRVIAPERFTDEGGNADSLCLLVTHQGSASTSIFFTGDAEADQVQNLLEQDLLGEVGVLKVGHHGSAKSLTADIVQALNPKVALISVGAHNRYGHPTDSILELLTEQNTTICRTDHGGDHILSFRDKDLSIRTRPSA